MDQLYIVVVNQAVDRHDLSKLTAFGPPMSEEQAEHLMWEISNGVDEEEFARYDIHWVIAMPYHSPQYYSDKNPPDQILSSITNIQQPRG